MFTMLSGIGIATVTFWTQIFTAIWNWFIQLFN